MSGQTFRESRTLTRAQMDQMDAAASHVDMTAWSLPVIEAMSELMEQVRRQMLAAGMRPTPGAYAFSIVFEAEGVPRYEQAGDSA